MKKLNKYLFLSIVGGCIYFFIEILWRGYSNWTMALLGAICFICLGLINELLSWQTPIWKQMLLGATIITTLEFVTGCIVNLWLGWKVWNYSNLPFNILGQICPQFFVLWFFLSLVGIVLDDYLRHWLFQEETPHYYLF